MENKKLIYLLKNLVGINSTFPNESKISLWLEKFLTKSRYKVNKQLVEKNRHNLIVEKGSGLRNIILYSHLDTVNLTGGWISNPFKLKIEGDNAYGLGAWDMKAGMTANILTFLNYNPKKIKLKLVFCVDEENISKGGYKLIKSNFLKRTDCVISTEPAFKNGLQGIVTGRTGRAVYIIKIQSKSRHFAFYSKKFDVNLFLGKFLETIASLYRETNNKKQFVFARKIESDSSGMSLPEKTVIELDAAILYPDTSATIKNQIKKMLLKTNTEFDNYFKLDVQAYPRKTPFLDGYQIDTNNDYLKILKNSVQEVTKKSAIPYFRTSVADENIFGARGITTLSIGPEGDNAHSANERVSLTSIEKLISILTNFLATVDKNNIK